MTKKTRLSFSSISIEEKKDSRITPTGNAPTSLARRPTSVPEQRKQNKSSTYQYSKFGKGGGRRGKSFSANKPQSRTVGNGKIPPVEAGVIRIIPLGGVEEPSVRLVLWWLEDSGWIAKNLGGSEIHLLATFAFVFLADRRIQRRSAGTEPKINLAHFFFGNPEAPGDFIVVRDTF